jgi:hypothetical protein
MGEARKDALRVDFDSRTKLEFHGAAVTSDAGLVAYRELDEALGLTAMRPARKAGHCWGCREPMAPARTLRTPPTREEKPEKGQVQRGVALYNDDHGSAT